MHGNALREALFQRHDAERLNAIRDEQEVRNLLRAQSKVDTSLRRAKLEHAIEGTGGLSMSDAMQILDDQEKHSHANGSRSPRHSPRVRRSSSLRTKVGHVPPSRSLKTVQKSMSQMDAKDEQ